MDRRTVLSTTLGTIGLLALAGCLDGDGDAGDGLGEPEGFDDGDSADDGDDGLGSGSVAAAVDITGDGSDEVVISVRDGGNADQLVILEDGVAVGDGVDATAGTEVTATEVGVDSSGEYTVHVIRGELEAGDRLDSAEAAAQVGSFTYEG